MDDRFQTVRTVTTLETWEHGQSRQVWGRMADWAVIPDDVTLPCRGTVGDRSHGGSHATSRCISVWNSDGAVGPVAESIAGIDRAIRPLPNHPQTWPGRDGRGLPGPRREHLDRQVALKIPCFSGGESRETVERFLRKARAAAVLDHPHLCPVYDVGQIEGIYYLTMAYIEGRPLSQLIKPGTPWPEREAAKLVRQVALAIQERMLRASFTATSNRPTSCWTGVTSR